MRRISALVALLGGCAGVSEYDFIVDYEVQFCTTYPVCATPEMLEVVQERECLGWLRRQTYPQPPDCRYDRVAAEVCLEAIAAGTCDGVDPELPALCDDVYSGCALPRLPKGGVEPVVERGE